MLIYATLKNERGGKKSTGDNTRIRVELNYKNKIIGEIGFYPIIDEGEDLGYRLLWNNKIIEEKEKAKKKKAEYCKFCKKKSNHITDNEGDMYCEHCEMYQ